MHINLTLEQILELGVTPDLAQDLLTTLHHSQYLAQDPSNCWQSLSQTLLKNYPFSLHLLLFNILFPAWHTHPESAPAWLPHPTAIVKTNIYQFMFAENMADIRAFHQWTVKNYAIFWQKIIAKLNIKFAVPFTTIADVSHSHETPHWLPGAKLNIVDSCFNAAPHQVAIIYEGPDHILSTFTYGELHQLVLRVANSLLARGFKKNEAIGICMPMNLYAVAIYLGIIKIGGVVVSIADSFSSEEIAIRLSIAHTKAIFTQDKMNWGGKDLPLYEKIARIDIEKIIVLPTDRGTNIKLRDKDCYWEDFLIDTHQSVHIPCDPMDWCNILFSSGTTAQPKAIPWSHITPIKAASDAYFHHNIQQGDVIAWPTNLGWMMGPWLIFAAFINQATIALYEGIPKEKAFGEFISRAKVNILGVVPTLVASWRQTGCMENLNWHQHIKLFTSTGECSNPEDMLYLMSLAHYKPVIEYCGGTEIGGAYITSTLMEKNYPSLFSTPAMGINFILLDEDQEESEQGEVALISPSIGLSHDLLNANHDQIYYANMPTYQGRCLRRHGDQIKKLSNGYYCILGRIDDSMNLGGIKVSAAEVERVIAGIPNIIECAAIAISPKEGLGPSQLVIYAVSHQQADPLPIKQLMQQRINKQLNPFFKIHEVIFIKELPKTASNKIMRRELRKKYCNLS